MSGPPPLPLLPYAGAPGAQMLFVQPPGEYASAPPALTGLRLPPAPTPADLARARAFLALLARPSVACPAEAVMLYRGAHLLDGWHVVTAEGAGIAESFDPATTAPDTWDRRRAQLARIAAGTADTLPASGPPVVAISLNGSFNFGHMLAEILPRLVHVAALGLTRIRLLLPHDAARLRHMVDFALLALGLEAEIIACPFGSVLRVPALHWVSPVSRHDHRKSPTLLRLMQRMAALAPPPDGPQRLYVARPAGVFRQVRNAAAVEAIAREAGYAVVEPAALPFPAQIALFAGARRVAGPMGSALALAAAMPPGGEVAMFEAGNGDFFFWDLACLAGHRFHWAFTAPLAAWQPDMLRRDMTIDPQLARLVLHGLEERPPAL